MVCGRVLRLETLIRVAIVLPLLSAALCSVALALPCHVATFGLQASAAALAVATSALVYLMRDVTLCLNATSDDLVLVSCLDLEAVSLGTDHRSMFHEVQRIDDALSGLVRIMFECRSYLPTDVLLAIENTALDFSPLTDVASPCTTVAHMSPITKPTRVSPDADVSDAMIRVDVAEGPVLSPISPPLEAEAAEAVRRASQAADVVGSVPLKVAVRRGRVLTARDIGGEDAMDGVLAISADAPEGEGREDLVAFQRGMLSFGTIRGRENEAAYEALSPQESLPSSSASLIARMSLGDEGADGHRAAVGSSRHVVFVDLPESVPRTKRKAVSARNSPSLSFLRMRPSVALSTATSADERRSSGARRSSLIADLNQLSRRQAQGRALSCPTSPTVPDSSAAAPPVLDSSSVARRSSSSKVSDPFDVRPAMPLLASSRPPLGPRGSYAGKSSTGSAMDGLSALQMGMRRRKGTLLSVSIDVTELAGFDLPETFELCSSLVCVVLEIVQAELGEVCMFGADRVLSSWNTHAACPRQALAGCRAALQIQQAILREPEGGGACNTTPPAQPMCPMSPAASGCDDTEEDVSHWSIAIATGCLFCGIIGTDVQRSPFLFGHVRDQVELLNKLSMRLRTPILVAESTRSALHCPELLLRSVDVVDWGALGCMESPRELVYELMGDGHGEIDLDVWREAFLTFVRGDIVRARAMFEAMPQAGRDMQIGRMVKLLGSGTLPQPYCRGAGLWKTFAAETQEPETLITEGRCRQKKKSSVLSKAISRQARSKDPAHAVEQKNTLWHAIAEAQRTRSFAETSITSTVDSLGCASSSPPTEFTDGTGAQWRRSTYMIGRGAIGDVWLGMSGDGSFVALKCVKLPKQLIQSEPHDKARLGRRANPTSDIHSIVNEVEVLSKYRHESIVSFISCGVYEDFVIIAMEYVSNGSLARVIDQFGALPLATVRRYTREILVGLQYLHRQNVVHCDLKPANVLIQTDGCCKLSDFGTSQKLSSVAEKGGPEGTPLFMAPELCRGAPCPASDVWALGLTVAQMLVAAHPFSWDSDISALARHQFLRWLCQETGEVPLPAAGTIDASAAEFIAKLMVRDPEARPRTDALLYDIFVMS